jgi:hypothetical protein
MLLHRDLGSVSTQFLPVALHPPTAYMEERAVLAKSAFPFRVTALPPPNLLYLKPCTLPLKPLMPAAELGDTGTF